MDDALEKACNTIESFTTNPLPTSIATLLDSKSYGTNDIKAVIKNTSKMKDHFNNLLKASDFKEHLLGKYFAKYKLDKPCRK